MWIVSVVTNLLPFEYQWKTASWQYWKTCGITGNGSGWRQDDITSGSAWSLGCCVGASFCTAFYYFFTAVRGHHAWWTDYNWLYQGRLIFFKDTQGTGLATGALSHLFAIWVVPHTYNNKTHTHGWIGMDVVLAVLDPNCSSQCFVITVCQLIWIV